MNSSTRRKLILFQVGNLLVSLAILAAIPVGIQGSAMIYVLFAIKVITLSYLNDYPAKKNIFSVIFFGLASIEVILLFFTGSFSVYTYGIVRL